MKRCIASCVFAATSSLLIGCAHTPPAAVPLARASDNEPGHGAVLVRFEPRDNEHWSLRRADGSYVCTLPCSYWVRPSSGMMVHLEGPSGSTVDGTTTLPVPDHLAAQPGDTLPMVADRTHGLGTAGKVIAAPTAVIFGLMGIGFTGISIASLATGSKNTTTSVSGSTSMSGSSASAATTSKETSTGVAAGAGGLAIGIGALTIAGLCTWWFFHAHEGGLEAGTAQPAHQRARTATQVWVSPMGVAGTF